MMYMPRNTTKSSVWSWGSLVRPKSSNLISRLRFVPFIFIHLPWLWGYRGSTGSEAEHPGGS
jgi:hypothetical protein